MMKFFSEIKYDAEFIRGHSLQPKWYKALKVFLILGYLGGYYAFFGKGKTLLFCGIFFGLSILMHIIYRVKTHKFTQSWLDFVVFEDGQGHRSYRPIGPYYYLAVGFHFILAVILSQILL